jgi:ABC-type nitrate/sulfonate/bicarbonate transport system substrate-binding protein
MMTRRDWLKGMSAAAAWGLTQPGLRAGGPTPDSAMLQLGWIWNVEYAGELVAQEKGYYTSEGLNLDIHPGGPQVDEMVMLMARKAIVMVGDVMTAGQARNHGAKIKLIGATFQKSPFSITSLPENPIRTPQDLPGKKIGVAAKQAWSLKFLCEANKIDPHSFTVLPVEYDPAPLVNHEVDGFVSFATNQPIQLNLRGIATVSMLFADFGLSEFTDTLTVREDALNDPGQRSIIAKILKGTIRGWQDAVDQPEAAAKLVIARFGDRYQLTESAQLKTLLAQIPFISTPESQKNGLLTMSEQQIAANIETLNRVGVPISRDLFDTTLIQEVTGGRPRI